MLMAYRCSLKYGVQCLLHKWIVNDMIVFNAKGDPVGVCVPTKSYLYQVRRMWQAQNLGVYDRLIDEKKMWPSQLLFKTTSEFKTSEYSVFR